jgi:DNA-binding MarR family transcriptional regulator
MQSKSAPTDPADALLTASRVLVGIAASSLSPIEDEVTLSQYRTLVVLHSRGPQTLQDLADELQVVPSTASRMCDRLVRKELIEREPSERNRREIELRISTGGAAIVAKVARARRRRLEAILGRMPADARQALVSSLEAFSAAAGEVPESQWYLGWE